MGNGNEVRVPEIIKRVRRVTNGNALAAARKHEKEIEGDENDAAKASVKIEKAEKEKRGCYGN